MLFLQEIQGEHQRHASRIKNWPSVGQFEFLAGKDWLHHVYGKNAIYHKGHHGNAIISKYNFCAWENINVSLMKTASRSLLHGTLEVPYIDSKIHVICVHLGLFEHERERQLERLINRIHSHVPHNEALIIAGDFNDWRRRAERYLSHVLGVKEVFKDQYGDYAKTFPAWMPILPMDRIYTRGLEIKNCYRLSGSSWKRLSDHLPLVSEFALKNNQN